VSGPGVAPYRVLFPLGILFGIVGTALWPLHALSLIPYPTPLHPRLMIQGFEHCFILGFLLTAMPSFLHARHATRAEIGIAAGAMAGFLVLGLAGLWVPAEALYLATLILVLVMGATRFHRDQPPPEEFLFVGVGLCLGLVGGGLQLLSAARLVTEPTLLFGLHVISYGMVLSIVLGVGGLLVPTFTSMRDPLVIPGLARPHQRGPRRVLYAFIVTLLIAALVLEARSQPEAAVRLRAFAATIALLGVWKIFRRPGARDLLSYVLWGAGWMILVGLWMVAVAPLQPLPGLHVFFIGGLGLLTAGIATRVTVRHGGHPLAAERRVLSLGVPVLLVLALLARVAAVMNVERAPMLLSLGATFWISAWILWGSGAFAYLWRVRPSSAPVRLRIPPRAVTSAPGDSPSAAP
jgi:uncharacterized protein involved in response to NO